MNETVVTVVGNVATTPVFRELPTGSVARFRLAVTARHRDRVKETWVDGHTNFFTVCAWRLLGANVMASVNVGDPVIVQGRLKVRNEERGGQQWMSADIDALAIGHDMSRGTSDFRRGGKRETAQAAQATQSEAAQGQRSPAESVGEPPFGAGADAVASPEPVFETQAVQVAPEPASVT
ncbi:single-stranded DNA-binding protein [Streptomyces himalayensis]|uniref:Single-stranded DNA-binding protein n=1 Tax=Streptomyces himalayensis subsp. himalayensis TaxID=2756131 RepID=A0A7W0DSC7_9ACTN|nr:single-stranded DNA-binding protein [Streptomyces himalayensis]MBA2950326.1 single-stranded DNA-binding protein [Streptomyces himalayensis subsp. himalayensis]